MKIIEALNQSGTIAYLDEKTNQRTQWVAVDIDTPESEYEYYLDNQDLEWVDASDLEDDQGIIQYRPLGE